MRGQWESQTRKLNRHYQSAGGNNMYQWDPSNKYLIRMKKGNEYYYPAPWYAYFKSGELVQKVNFAEMQFTDFIDGISVYEEKGIELLPYLPKTSDNFYTGNTQELTFVANKDFDMVITDENGDHVIGSYKSGENINSVSCNLLKLKYDLYVTKKDGFDNYTVDELFDIYNKIYSKAKCSGKPEFSQTYDSSYADSFLGLFSASTDPSTEQQLMFMSGMIGNNGYSTHDDNHAGYALFGLRPQYFANHFWNGEQRINSIHVGPLWSDLINRKTGGFYTASKYDIDTTNIYSGLYNARFKTWYILREVDTWKGAITG